MQFVVLRQQHTSAASPVLSESQFLAQALASYVHAGDFHNHSFDADRLQWL